MLIILTTFNHHTMIGGHLSPLTGSFILAAKQWKKCRCRNVSSNVVWFFLVQFTRPNEVFEPCLKQETVAPLWMADNRNRHRGLVTGEFAATNQSRA